MGLFLMKFINAAPPPPPRLVSSAPSETRNSESYSSRSLLQPSPAVCYSYRREGGMYLRFTSYLWRKYADYLYTKREKNILWEMVDPYRRPKSFTPLVTTYIAAFYTGVIAAAITEQLYKEKYWEEHPGKEVPLMRPKFYGGPWRVYRGEALPPDM